MALVRGMDEAVMNDPVNSPTHYTEGDIECIDAIRAALDTVGFSDYCVGNAMKYLWRWRYKNGYEDLAKATFYIRMAQGDDPRKGGVIGRAEGAPNAESGNGEAVG